MKLGNVLRSGLLVAFLPCLVWSANLTVYVTDGNGAPVSGADVIAVNYGPQGPDSSLSQMAASDSDGKAYLTLGEGLSYQVMAVKSGCMPSAREQMFNYMNYWVTGGTKTIQLRPVADADKARDLRVTVTHDALEGRIIFLNLMNKNTYEPAGMGFAVSEGSSTVAGPLTCRIYSAPTKEEDFAYELNVYDPSNQRGNRKSISHKALAGENNCGTMYIGNGAVPPPTRMVQTDEKLGEIVFEGTVEKADHTPLTEVRIMVHSPNDPTFGEIQTQTDDNGYFAIYENADLNNPIFTEGNDYSIDFMRQGYVGTFKSISPFIAGRSTFTITMEAATGKIKGVIKINDIAIPQGQVNVWPDWNNYSGGSDNNPGMGNGMGWIENGTFLIDGLPSGRYNLNGWSEFNNQPISYNWGLDGQQGSQGNWGDDLIVEIDTMTSVFARVLRASDNSEVVAAESDIVINVSKPATGTNSVSGTISFTGADIDDPASVLIVARQNYSSEGQMPKSGFTVLRAQDLVSPGVYSYTISGLEDGTYQVRVKAPKFGMKVEDDNARTYENLSLSGGKSASINFTMAPAGSVTGTLRTPKGTIFRPQFGGMSNTGASVNAGSEETKIWEYCQVNKDGVFTIEGLVPGSYNLRVTGYGSDYHYANTTLENIKVEANETFTVEIPLKEGVRINPVFSESLPQDIMTALQDRTMDIGIVFLPADAPLNVKNMDQVIGSKGGDQPNKINFWGDGFEPTTLEPGAYNFYVVMSPNFPSNAEHFSKIIIGRAKNVVVDRASATDSVFMNGSTTTVQNIPITMTLGRNTFSGTYVGVNTMRPDDLQLIAKNFNLFLSYVPKVTLVDNDGNILAAGMCTPVGTKLRTMLEGVPESEIPARLATAMNDASYGIEYLPALSNIHAVVTTPNYPPLMRKVSVPGTLNVNMDTDVGAGAQISGTIRSAAGDAIGGAIVRIRGRILDRTVMSKADGSYLIPGLAPGAYRLLVKAEGYALDAEKMTVFNQNELHNFALTVCSGTITGTVYAQKFPYPLFAPGAKVVAYDDTANGENPDKELAIYEAIADNNGVYTIKPVIEGHTYKVILTVPGKAVQVYAPSPEVPAGAGSTVSGIDFTYSSVPPRVKLIARPDPEGPTVTLQGESPKKLVSLTAKYVEGQAYTDTGALALTVVEVGQMTYAVTLPDKTKYYAVRFIADDGASAQPLDFVYNPSNKAQTIENIEQQAAASGEVLLDDRGTDASGIFISPGSITLSDGSSPDIVIDKENRDTSASLIGTDGDVIGGDVYHVTLTLDGSQQNENKTLTLTLAYDPRLIGGDTGSLTIRQYNPTTQTWDPVQGSVMVDPFSGTVSVEVASIDNAAGTNAAPRTVAKFDGKQYRLSPRVAGAPAVSQQGIFMVSRAPTRTAFAGGSLEVFNTPNPFNLKNKTVTLDAARGGSIASITTAGTIIRFAVPTSLGTNVKTRFRIYNVAGEMVRELNANEQLPGGVNGGYYYYLDWDGKNTDGEKCASGVYLCVAEVGTQKKVIKMALIK